MRHFVFFIFIFCFITFNVVHSQNSGNSNKKTASVVKMRADSCIIKIANKPGGVITIEEMIKAGAIEIDKCFNYKIISFDMSLIMDGILYVENSRENKFNSAMAPLIKRCSQGTKIYIENIKVKDPSGVVIALKGTNYTITNAKLGD